jgi:hypothetical protein
MQAQIYSSQTYFETKELFWFKFRDFANDLKVSFEMLQSGASIFPQAFGESTILK